MAVVTRVCDIIFLGFILLLSYEVRLFVFFLFMYNNYIDCSLIYSVYFMYI